MKVEFLARLPGNAPARRPRRPQPKPQSVEARLASKARDADNADHTGQRSLGQMSREERRKALFGE